MKTITTKYLPITAKLPARVSASDEDGNKVTIRYEGDKDHDNAAYKLCKKMDWNRHNLVRGNQKSGNVYVFLEADAVIPLADPLIANKIAHALKPNERALDGINEATDKIAFLQWMANSGYIDVPYTGCVAISNAWIKHKIALAAAIPTDPGELAAQVETANELFAEIKAEEKVERPNPLADAWDVFRKTDWTELRAQKQAVVNAQSRGGSIADYEKFEGLVNFLDAIQDAAEAAGFPAYPEINYADLSPRYKKLTSTRSRRPVESVPESDPDLTTLTAIEANAWAETPGIGWQESLHRRQLVDAVEVFKAEPETLPVARLQIVNHGTHSSSEAFVSAQVFGAGDKGDITEQLAAEHKGSQLILDDITIADGQIIEFNPGRVTATPGKRFRINITEVV